MHVLQRGSRVRGELCTSGKRWAPEQQQIKEMNCLRKYYCWIPKTSKNTVATWGAQRGREETLKLIKQNWDVRERQSCTLETQTVNEHMWLKPNRYALPCLDHLSAGRAGRTQPPQLQSPSAHSLLSLASLRPGAWLHALLCVLDEHPVGATETALPSAPTCQPHIWGSQPGALPTHIPCAVPVALSKRKLPVFMEDGSETRLEALSSSHLREERDLQRCWVHLPHPPPTPSPRVPPERCTRGRLQELSCQGSALHAMLPRQILALGSVVA